jgi:hypothetical protein
VEKARILNTKSDLLLTMGHYLNNMGRLTEQWNSRNYKELDRQRIYLKDIDCPQVWHDKLKDIITPGLYYLNESTNENQGVAKAGDLMSCLPPEMRAENMMCYIGHEGTYTPAHREMCASLGQNIMVEASSGGVENGSYTKPGSSIWFMTETKERQVVSEYWLSTLGHDMEVENHFAQINAWKAAPFKTYIVEQKVGDFILIPPLAPHQVWNRGTRTMKVAWNRTTVETLERALNEALPRARLVCRDEQYKNKAMIYYALSKYSTLLKTVETQKRKVGSEGSFPVHRSKDIRQLHKDFRRLFTLYTRIILSETFSTDNPEGKKIQLLPFDGNVTCGYCRSNIFNRFLTCPSCVSPLDDGEEDAYDICMECYAMGRSCACLSKLKWVEQFPWDELVQRHDAWRHQIIAFEGEGTRDSPNALHVDRENLGTKTLAQICQEELKRRPWNDITKPPTKEPIEEDGVIDVDDEGKIRKKRKIRRSEKWQREHGNCHICRAPEPTWKLATCTQCSNSYCYGSLFRAFDLMPQTVMENLSWKCPKCLMICSCSTCRKDPAMNPFQPEGTVLGHDTSKVADPRSVESLVDFRVSNVTWLKKAGDDQPYDSRRMRRRQEEAAKAKLRDPTLGDDYVEHDAPVEHRLVAAMRNAFPIDPLLGDDDGTRQDTANENTSDSPQFVSPNQLMYHEDLSEKFQRGVSEGITYVYPDPDNPHYIRPPSPRPEYRPIPPTTEDDIIITSPSGKKRKKLGENGSLQGPSTQGKAQQRVQSVKKAGTPGGTPKSLILRLPASRSKLAMLNLPPLQKPTTTTTQARSEDVEIIHSDLKPVDTTPQEVIPQVLRTKVRLERDDEFQPRKDRKDRRKNGASRIDRTSLTYMDAVELSDDDGVNGTEALDYSSIRNRSKSESKWLALRKGSEDASAGSSPNNHHQLDSDPSTDTVPNPQSSEPRPTATLPTRGTNGHSVSSDKPTAVALQKDTTAAAEQIEENRRAKMEAVRWAEGALANLDDSGSDRASRPSNSPAMGHSFSSQRNGTAPSNTKVRSTGASPAAPSSINHKPKNAIRPSRGRGGSSIGRSTPRASLNE